MNFKSLIKNVALGTLLEQPELAAEDISEDTEETFSSTSGDATETVGPEVDQHIGVNKEPPGNVHIHENIKEIVQKIINDAVDKSEGVYDDNSNNKDTAVVLSGLKLVPSSSLLSPAKGLLQQALESTQDESGSFVQKNSLLASLLVSNTSTENTPGVAREFVVPNHQSASHVTINVPKPVNKVNKMINIRTLGQDQRISDEAAQTLYSQVINQQGSSKSDGSNADSKQHFKTPLLLIPGRPKSKGLPQARIAPSTPPLCFPTGSDSSDQAGLTQVSRSQCQPKLDQAKLLGVFNTAVSTPSLSSKPYIAVVFDKGTLFVPNTDNSGSQWRTKSAKKVGHTFDLKLFRTNPARASYDTVELNLNFAIFTVEKPGSAAKVISDVELGSCFYLQATAVVRVDTFFIHDKGQRWIMSAELVSDLCESTNSDILCFLQRSSIINQSEETARDPIADEEELTPPTLPVTHPPLIMKPKTSTPARSPLSLTTVPSLSLSTTSVAPSSTLLTSVQDAKYPALTVLQSMHCTNCANCKKKFKYTIEYLFHFVFQKSCQRALVNGKCEKSLFYQKIQQAIAAKVKVPQHKLVCVKNVGVQKTCGFQSKTVLQYCMHNDKHVPDNNEIFPCYFCAGIYFSPFSFYRHKCLVQLKNIQGKKSSTQNSLFSIYSAIPLETQTKILTCPACSKRYEYISGLLNHLKKTNSKCLNLLTKCYSKYITKDKYFDVAEMISSESHVELTPLTCEVCLEEVANQVSYCMHKDHHEVGGDSKFVCKECSTQFNSPCSFYRHSCRSPNMNWCALCEKVEPSSGFRKKVEEIVIDDEVVKVKEERNDEDYEIDKKNYPGLQTVEENMGIPRIVSTSGSVEFSPVKETQVESSPSGSESSIDTPKSCTDPDALVDTSELLLAETVLADKSHDNQKKRKLSTDEGNIPKKRCNLKKRGISKEFDENFIETKPIILDKAIESDTEKTAKEASNINKVEEESQAELKVNKTSVIPELKKEVDESKYEFDYWDCYLCTDCSPLKMLGGADGLVNHCREVDGHTDIRPLWTFNQNEVKVTDLKKSYKYGVLVREKEREYLEYTNFKQSLKSVYKSTGLLYSTFHQQDMLVDESQKLEEPKLKLKIGKGANGKFSVLS